ncbi:hypothetical protein WJX74_001059 [Apatococcus lobatus]|uniref:Protein kinase domain-containing protein n=1 Tax=Apatococcus lobatus TaxID=904363 RepID=A0AAW1RHE2_9CHLO
MTPFWNVIGMEFPEQIGQLLGLDIVIDRNVEEMTIAERLLKRDYMCKLEYRPCIVGVDKSNPNQQQEAIQDAADKHRTLNAVTYGRLGYILMVTMAGSWMAVHGMPLIANLQTQDLIPLIRPFEIVSPFGRTKAVTTAINLTRWILTVGKLRLLSPAPAADLNEVLVRPSPYLGTDYHMVSMRLEPVGANWLPPSPVQLWNLTESLLTTLQALHAHGHVHRDISSDNILSVSRGWMLIDWELAAPIGSPASYTGIAEVLAPNRAATKRKDC